MQPTRVAILEDHKFVREVLEQSLRTHGFDVVLVESRAAPFLARLPHATPDVAIVDLGLDGPEDGLEVVREVRTSHPSTRTLVLTGSRDPDIAERCLQEGASGFLDKLSAGGDLVVTAVTRVAGGERFLPAEDTSDLFRPRERSRSELVLGRLTAREREVLAYLATGADNLKIASHLGITERTVKAHVSSLYRKLECENRTSLALKARQLGIQLPAGV